MTKARSPAPSLEPRLAQGGDALDLALVQSVSRHAVTPRRRRRGGPGLGGTAHPIGAGRGDARAAGPGGAEPGGSAAPERPRGASRGPARRAGPGRWRGRAAGPQEPLYVRPRFERGGATPMTPGDPSKLLARRRLRAKQEGLRVFPPSEPEPSRSATGSSSRSGQSGGAPGRRRPDGQASRETAARFRGRPRSRTSRTDRSRCHRRTETAARGRRRTRAWHDRSRSRCWRGRPRRGSSRSGRWGPSRC